MVKQRREGAARAQRYNGVRQPPKQRRPGIVQSSIYLPIAMHDALREAAFKERRKIHDIMLEGIRLVLSKRRNMKKI
jgi:hypothetical protein